MNKLANFRLFSYLEKLSEWAFKPSSILGRLPRFVVLMLVFYIFIVCFIAVGILLINVPYLTLFSVLTMLFLQLYSIERNLLFLSGDKKLLSIAMASCGVITIIGISLFVLVITPYAINKYVFSKKCMFPLGDLDGIALSDNKCIYVSLPFYGRIQKYDLEGHFIESWPVDSAGGKYSLWADEQNNINIAVSRTHTHIIYNSNGDIINKTKVPIFNEWEKLIENVDPYFTQDSQGNRYVLKKSKWFPTVIKINPTGKEEAIIKDPLQIAVNRAPFPALLYVIIGIIISLILKVLKNI
jgi:hypothetical protein